MKEYYFCLKLTENEHYIVEDMVRDFCEKNNLKVEYYRKFKLGHIPMYREVKVVGRKFKAFKKFLEDEYIADCITRIPDEARPIKREIST